MFRVSLKPIAMVAVCATSLLGQQPPGPQRQTPLYRVLVESGIDAVAYQYGAAPSKVDFRGTVLLPDAKGEATVRSRLDGTAIDAHFEKLAAPSRFGRGYLSYVLWAVTPEGGARNLGEIVPDVSGHARLRVSTSLQTFAMMVTAEPYFSVRQPGDVVALENHVRRDTVGKAVPVQPKPELLTRTPYTFQVPRQPQPEPAAKVSVSQYQTLRELYQAENAVAIAGAANAQRYAPDAWAAAQRALSEAQRLESARSSEKLVIQNARNAAQSAEDARVIAERARTEQAAAVSEANREIAEPALRARLRQQVEGSLLTQDTRRGLVITLPETAFDGTDLLKSIGEKLAPVAAALRSQPGVRVEVEGYMGSAELASWERAQAVRNALVSAGVAPGEVSMRGGMTAPAVSGEDRLVRIVISGNSVAAPTASPAPAPTRQEPLFAANADRVQPAASVEKARAWLETIALSTAPPPASARAVPDPPAVQPLPPAPPFLRPQEEAAWHHARGRQLLEQERYAEALEELNQALRLDPSLALAYNARGFAHFKLRQYTDALADFDAAIRLNPAYGNAYLNRSVCRRASGDPAGAEADRSKARELAAAR